MNTLVIEKQTGGYFKFTLNGDTANAITSIQNDLLAVGTQLHFKTGNGANIIKEQFIYPADVTIIASGTFTFTTVAQVWDKLIDIDYFAWLGGGGTGGVDRFDDLLDTFSYTGNAGKAVVVDGSELRLVPITLYNKRLFTELEDTPSSLVPNKMLVVNPAGTAVVLQDQPEQPEQLLNSVGYFDYNDLITQTTPLNAVANVALKLTNDTEGANTSTDQNPYGVSYVWDYTTNQFNFNELEVGDTIDVRVHVQVTTTSANQRVLLSAKFGIGSVAEFTNIIYENQFKSAGLHEINFVAPFYMGSTYITDNPAELYLTTDSSATVKVDGWYVRILRKNINIITVDYTVPDATTTVKGIVRLAGDLAGTANSPTVPELANKVPTSRTVSTTSPLLGGGALSSNLTLSIQQANSVDSGYLSNVDWSTFNGKANDNAVVKLTGDQSITGSKSFTTNTAAPAMVVTNNSTDNGILLQNTSTGRGITSNNVSTGIGIRSDNTGGGTGISSSNTGAGTGIVSTNTSTTGSALSISNSSTGYGILLTNSTGTGISSSNTGSGTGFYSNNSSTGNGIQSINSSSGYGISSSNTGSGRGIYSSNNSTGDAINIANSGSGRGIYLTNASTGNSLILNNGTAATGMPFTVSKNGTDKFTINDAGEATGVKFIKSGGTSSQFLKADGSVDSSTYALTSQLHDAVTIGTANGLSLSGQVLSLALASPTTRGALTSEDYNYFFDKVQGNGNQNYIPKYIFSGSNKVIGNSQIYDNGTNVGIGTTSPITGNLVISPTTANGTVEGLSILFHPDGALSRERVKLWINDFNGQLDLKDSAEIKRVQITSLGNSYFNGGNVGIGTTSPGALLHLATSSGNGSAMRFESTSTNGRTYGIGSNFATGVGEFAIYDYTANTERMRITSGGNVGIGTTSPNEKLQVLGNIRLTNNNLTTANTLSSEINNYNGSTNQFKSSSIKFLTGTYVDQGHITFNTSISGVDQERVRIAETGNVGIGTTSPGGKLHVVGVSGDPTLTAGTAAIATFTPNGVGTELVMGSSASSPFTFWMQNRHTGINGLSYPIALNPLGGNVGIGTTSPVGKLSVIGDIIIGQYADSITNNLDIRTNRALFTISPDGVTNGNGTIISYSWANGGQGPLRFNNASGEVMRLSSSGNVGIGTTSPTNFVPFGYGANIEASGGRGGGFVSSNSDSTVKMVMHVDGSAGLGQLKTLTNHALMFATNDTERMRITSGGNVGIGTTSPSKKLDVNGTASVSGIMSIPNMPYYANNAAALAGGLTYGDLYYSADASSATVKIVINFG